MLIQRYSNILRGQMTFTGNTLGFSRTPSYRTGIDVFLSTKPNLSVPDYPSPSTLLWQENGSTAVLQIPAGSTIEYAELIWGGSSVGSVVSPPITTLPISTLNTPITFIDSLGSPHTISFEPLTALESEAVGQIYYVRSQNVTNIVKNAGGGTYEVNGVPAVTNPSPSQTASAGWTLAVVYSNPNLPYRFLELDVGNDLAFNFEPPIDELVTGFITLPSGQLNGRLLLSAIEGESSLTGDYVSMGPTMDTLTMLSGPNNLVDNFFTSTINNNLGLIDTSGSFGNLNQSPGSTNPGCRNAWDITNIDISTTLINSQQQADIRIGTTGDTYVLSTLGVQIDTLFPDININKSVNKSFVLVGNTITYTSVITNTGNAPIQNIIFTDSIPNRTTYVNPSITINGVLYPLLNPNTPIDLGSILPLLFPLQPNEFITVSYTVTVNQTISGTVITNTSSVEFEYLEGSELKTLTETSNTVSSTVVSKQLSITKKVDKLFTSLGKILTYTLTVTNTGTITTENTIVTDNIPSGSTFVQNSVTVNNITIPNVNPQDGINLGNISPSQVVTLTFQVVTNNIQVVTNNATVNYIFIPSPGATPISDVSISNTVETIVAIPFNCDPFGYKVASVSNISHSYLSKVNLLTGKQTVINDDLGLNINGIGYSSIDNFIYGIEGDTTHLIILDSTGNVLNLGAVSNLPVAMYNVGAIDSQGHLFIYSELKSRYYVIDVNESSPNYTKLVNPTNGFILDTPPFGVAITPINIKDWAFNLNDGNLYAVQTNSGTVLRINPFSGLITSLNTSGVPNTGGYGSIYSMSDEFIYAKNNNTGNIYRIEINANNAIGIYFSKDLAGQFNDGASCLNAQLNIDFGDAPINYKTRLEENGPRHIIVDKLSLGAEITAENNAYASNDALGDDQILGILDDGVVLPLPNMPLNASNYTITVSVLNDIDSDAYIYGWLDFNKDGIFQTNESATAIVKTSALPQNVNLTFTKPSGVVLTPGNTFIRVRLTLDTLVNTGTLNQEDTRSFGPASSGEVEDYLLIIEDTKIVSNKSVNKVFADLGEILTYTVTLNNPGTRSISNVLFTDPLPIDVTYIGNLNVDVPYTGLNPITGITINTINPNQTVTISWDVQIGSIIPKQNPIINSGIVTIPGLSSNNTNSVSTQVKNATLTVNKNANKQTVLVGEIITYTIQIINIGNVNADPVIITDILPPSTTYVPGTLFINGISNPSDPSSGIDISPIIAGQTVNITFEVSVNTNPQPLPLENTAIVDYEYIVNPLNPPIIKSNSSNTVIVDVVDVDLVLSVDKKFALVGDRMNYTSVITNTGNSSIENIIFTDNIPSDTTYVNPSITINGVLYPLLAPNNPIDLGALLPLLFPLDQNEFITVSYSITVNQVTTGTVITNTSSLQFEYLNEFLIRALEISTVESNIVSTTVFEELLTITKSVDKQFANIQEILTYTLTVTNNSIIPTENTIITDDIPLGTTFIANSVTINELSIPGANPQNGINLGNISPSQVVVITFKVTTNNVQIVSNYATVSYNFIPSPGEPVLSDTATSNTVETVVAIPFTCEAFGYKVASVSSVAHSYLSKVNLLTGEQIVINDDLGLNVNAIGYNLTSNYIYGIEGGTNNLVLLSSDGSVINLGSVTNLPIDSYNVGAIDSQGHLFVYSELESRYYVIDVNETSPNYRNLVDPSAGFILDTAPFGTSILPISIKDWAFRANDGNLYAVQTNSGNVLRINPFSGLVTPLSTSGVPTGVGFGSVYSISDGFIYAKSNSNGNIYRIQINGNNATGVYFSKDIAGEFNDGASCLNATLLIDFGDAPISYKTRLEDNGPRHVIVDKLSLGAEITAENNAYASTDALGDDQILGIQDDGVVLPLPNMPLNASDYTITLSVLNDIDSDAYIYAWLDFNKDGIFQTNESATAIVKTSALPQSVNLTFIKPSGVILTPGDTFIRVRLTLDTLINTGGINQEDTRSFGPASNGEVEDYLLVIEDTKIVAEKFVNKKFSDVSEILTYTVTLNNPSILPINNVLFTDPLPNGVTYLNNLIIDALYTGVDPMSGITITTINPGQTVTISWNVQIGSTVPLINPIVNKGTVSVPGEENLDTNEVSTQVNNATLNLTKNTNKQTVLIGDTITYTIQVTNSGNVNANPAIITDILPSGTTYVPGTLFINGVFSPLDPTNGLNLSPITPSQIINIIFNVTVNNNPSSLPLQNTAFANYQYIVNPSNPPVTTSSLSNTVEVGVANVNISKSVNKPFALIGDTITYTSLIVSTGDVLIENIIFTDNIPSGTTYVDPSITINGVLYPLLNPNTPVDISIIEPSLLPLQENDFISISYTVTVNDAPLGSVITNISEVKSEYLDGLEQKTITKFSNPISSIVIEEDVDIIKNVDKEFVNLGEVITYTLLVINFKTVDINNVIVTDNIPLGTVFVINSVTIDDVSSPGLNPQSGINLGTVPSFQTVTITFKVIATNSQIISNNATLDYSFIPSPGLPPESDSFTSNTVTTISARIFNCEPFLYKVSSTSAISNSSFTQINLLTGDQNSISSDLGLNVNAIGYNILDNLIYGMDSVTSNLLIIDFNGSVIDLGTVSNLPVDNYNVGAIDKDGHLFIYSELQNNYYVIDVDITSNTFKELLDPSAGFIIDTPPFGTSISPISINDWAFNSNDLNLYTVESNTGTVFKINPLSGIVSFLTTTGIPGGTEYSSIYSINDGFIYATNNTSGEIFRIEINGNNASAILFSQDTPSDFNDGTSCLDANLFIDFGDTPSNYKTLLEDNGPRHGISGNLISTQFTSYNFNVNQIISSNLTLGSQITSEKNAYVSNDALGDDQLLDIQDDGTNLPLTNMALNASNYTITETVFNNTGQDANLYAWLDFNQDGIFQTNEGINTIVSTSAAPQNIILTFTLPGGIMLNPGDTFIRVRLTTDTLVNTGVSNDEDTRSIGPANDGEVEDYLLTIEDTQIISTKFVDKSEVDLEESFTYTVILNNPGTLPINNVLFVDTLPNGVTYENNLSVDTSFTGMDPMTGLTLTTINPGQTVTISWDVRALDTIPNPNPILNTAIITIPGLPPINTNTVTTQVRELSIHLTKNCDPNNISVGDTINYTFVISNNGIIDVNNIQFFDILEDNLEFVVGSFVGSTQSYISASDLVNGVDIGNLNSRNQKEISFQAVLTEQICPPMTCNTASITYEYELVPGETLESTSTSNECCNDILTTTFKQSFIDGNIEFSEDDPDIEILENLTVNSEVVNSVVIDSPEGVAESGQSLTGKKLLTCIKFLLTATYMSSTGEEITQEFEISTCEFIVIPNDDVVSCSTPTIEIEDLYYELVDTKKIFYNITYLIDTCC